MRAARAIMADLAATGMTPDQIALVMELSAAVSAEARPMVDESAERRRERDREYQAQKRAERRQTSADSDDVADNPPLSRPPNENISNPPTHTPPDINTRARKASHRMPESWEPAPLTGDAGKAADAWPPGALERELARFRDWAASASGPNAKKSDWNAAWRNWIRKRDDEGAYRNGKTNRTGGNGGDGRSSLARAIDDGIEFLDSQPQA